MQRIWNLSSMLCHSTPSLVVHTLLLKSSLSPAHTMGNITQNCRWKTKANGKTKSNNDGDDCLFVCAKGTWRGNNCMNIAGGGGVLGQTRGKFCICASYNWHFRTSRFRFGLLIARSGPRFSLLYIFMFSTLTFCFSSHCFLFLFSTEFWFKLSFFILLFGWSEVASGLSCGRNGAWQLQFALHYVIRQSPRSVARKCSRDDAPRGLPPLSPS